MLMELQKIKNLIDRYLEAKTTLEEEAWLQNYFSKAQLPEELIEYKDLFVFFKSERHEEQMSGLKPLPFKNEALDQIIRAQAPRKRKHYWSHAAAIAVLILGTYVPARQHYQKEQAKIAYQETLKAFTLLANNYKKATAAVGYLEEFEAAKTKIYNP